MIRSAFIRPVAVRRCFTHTTKNDTKNINFIATRSLSSSLNSNSNKSSCYHQYAPLNQLARQLNNNLNTPATRRLALRSTSSSTSNKDTQTKTDGNTNNNAEGGEPTSQEMVLTPGEKVVAGTRLFFWGGALTFASICAYYIGKELLPTKMSPNTIFDKASTKIHNHPDVNRRFGNFKTYGRDHGGHREGRRNFIEHTEYTNEDDGSKRVRVRFNLEGQYGNAFVFAEVSKEMKSGEFVYILVQDKRNGAVITVEDNRSALLAKRLAGGSSEGQDVFANLLGGGKK